MTQHRPGEGGAGSEGKGGGEGDEKEEQGTGGENPEDGKPEDSDKDGGKQPKAGETPEDTARRILRENADFEKGALTPGRRQYEQTDKDW